MNKAALVLGIIIAAAFFSGGGVQAENHTVGGSSGWDLQTDLQGWRLHTPFHAGDKLIFVYSPIHDVLEVNEADFNSCRIGSPIHTYSDGATVISLDRPITRYFICATNGHCQSGMKLQVKVLPLPAQPPLAAPATPTAIAGAASPDHVPSVSHGPRVIAIPSTATPPPAVPAVISCLVYVLMTSFKLPLDVAVSIQSFFTVFLLGGLVYG